MTKEDIEIARQALKDTLGYIDSVKNVELREYLNSVCKISTITECIGCSCLDCLLRGLDKLEEVK